MKKLNGAVHGFDCGLSREEVMTPTHQPQCQDYTLDHLRESFIYKELEFELEEVEEFASYIAKLERRKGLARQELEGGGIHIGSPQRKTKGQQMKLLERLWVWNYRSLRPSAGLNLEKQG